MNASEYKLNFDQFYNYINSIGRMHFVIDFSIMLRKNAYEILSLFKKLPNTRCCFYVSKLFDKQITQLVDDKESGFCTLEMLENIMLAWEIYSCLALHTLDDNLSSYEFFQKLSHDGHMSCLVTGNETEAWRHILSNKEGSVLLITDESSYFFLEEAFVYFSQKYGHIESFTFRDIQDDGSSGKCETSAVEKAFVIFRKKHIIQYTGIVNSGGAEGVIYKINEPGIAVKAFFQSVSDQKIKKIESLIAFRERKENFAWPIEFVYSTNHAEKSPIGFTMPLFENIRPLEELYNLDIATDRHRWKIAVSFLAQVLYLYLHGIQIGDYNTNNFSIDLSDCKVIFMDMDSYVYEQYGTQVHGRQRLPFSPDYSKHFDIIQADYLLLNSMVFQILADGLWPYYYDEDLGKTVSRKHINDKNFQDVLKGFPSELRRYYNRLFKKGDCPDPFELLFVLLEAEGWFSGN